MLVCGGVSLSLLQYSISFLVSFVLGFAGQARVFFLFCTCLFVFLFEKNRLN